MTWLNLPRWVVANHCLNNGPASPAQSQLWDSGGQTSDAADPWYMVYYMYMFFTQSCPTKSAFQAERKQLLPFGLENKVGFAGTSLER